MKLRWIILKECFSWFCCVEILEVIQDRGSSKVRNSLSLIDCLYWDQLIWMVNPNQVKSLFHKTALKVMLNCYFKSQDLIKTRIYSLSDIKITCKCVILSIFKSFFSFFLSNWYTIHHQNAIKLSTIKTEAFCLESIKWKKLIILSPNYRS